MEKEKPINTTFITRNKAIERKLMLLGHAFTQAVVGGEK